MNKDVTNSCIKEASQYTIGDMVCDTPYNLGVVATKLLNNTADAKCKKFLSGVFNEIILEK